MPAAFQSCEKADVHASSNALEVPSPLDVVIVAASNWLPYPPRQGLDAIENLFASLLGVRTDGRSLDARVGIVMHAYLEGPHPGLVRHVETIQALSPQLAAVLGTWRSEYIAHYAGGEWYNDAITHAHDMLRRGAQVRSSDTQRILVLVGDGSKTLTANRMAALAARPQREGTRIMAICFYSGPVCSTYEATVSVPADYILARRPEDYPAAVAELTRRVIEPRIVAASIEHYLAPEVEAVPASDAPPASFVHPDGRVLRWDLAAPLPAAITTTYRIAPQVEAWRGTAVTTTLTVTDDVGFSRVLDVSTADLEITGPCAPTATATPPPSATPTPSSIPTASPTTSPAPTATRTATSVPGPIYLPLALHERCDPTRQRIDVALVLDASTSMADPTRSGRPKIEAAVEAARAFLDLLALGGSPGSGPGPGPGPDAGDQAAIVAFNTDAWILAPLTADRTALSAALSAVALAPQTRLDRAVSVGAESLADPARRRAGNLPVLVLLTDGRANPVPIDAAVTEAAAAKAAGVTVFTIGLGDDVDSDGLAAMASSPQGFLRAPDGEDLAAAYATVARSIPCPASAWWGGR